MAVGTAFHPRTQPLCTSLQWKDWSGFHAVSRYDHGVEHEYSAFRNRCGVLDVSPLYKVRVRGAGAEGLLDRTITRDATKCRIGQVLYTPWCDERGKVVDDGTVQRLGPEDFRLTSAYPSYRWLEALSEGFDVELEEESEQVSALSIQGPMARDTLVAAGAEEVAPIKYFRLTETRLADHPVVVTRTGYTGDLGYELWMDRDHAVDVWDHLFTAGASFGITPAGLDALDMVRLEAGLILIDVDYHSARRALVEGRKSSAFEVGLGWAVPRKKAGPYVGRAALERERREGSTWATVGLELDWPEVETLLLDAGLPPEVPAGTCRIPVPLYDRGRQIGYTTSQGWSPILKKYIAIATVEAAYSELGSEVRMEVTVEYERRTARATVVPRPFFDPPRKRA